MWIAKKRLSEKERMCGDSSSTIDKELATEIDLKIGTPLEHELAIHTETSLLVYELESKLKEKLQLGIDTHLNQENDMATARSLLEHDPELQLTMKFEMVIDTQLERD